MRDTFLVIHILAVAAWFGTNLVQFLVTPAMGRKGGTEAADWHRIAVGFGLKIYMPAAVILIATGALLAVVDDSPYNMSDTFITVGFTVVIIGAVLGMAFFAPQGRKAADAYEAGDAAGGRTVETRIRLVALVDTALIVLAVVAMVGKWGI